MAKDNLISIRAVSKLGFIKGLAVAVQALYYILLIDYFGVSASIESYFAATTFAGILFHFTLAGHILINLIPIYHQFRERYSEDEATKIIWIVFNWLTVGLTVLIVGFMLLSETTIPFLLPGFAEEYQQLSVHLFYFIVPSVYFQVFNMILIGILNAKEIYNQGEINNLLANTVSILVMIFGYAYFNIWVLVISIWCQHLIGVIANLYVLKNNQISYKFVFSSPHFDHKNFFINSFYFLGFTLCTQLYIVVLTALLSNFSGGLYAVYKYVEGIFIRIGGLFTSAATTIFFTKYTMAFQKGGGGQIPIFNQAIKINLLIAIFTIAVIVGTNKDIVTFLWQNSLTAEESRFAIALLYCFFSTLLLTAFGELLSRMSMVAGYIKQLYTGWGIARILATAYAWFAITNFSLKGLLSLIIISCFLDNLLFFFIIYRTKQLPDFKIHTTKLTKWISISTFILLISGLLNEFELPVFNLMNSRYEALVSIFIKTGIICLLFGVWLRWILRHDKFHRFSSS